MGLVLACVVRILHDDWSIRLGENRPDQSSQAFVGYAVLKTLRVWKIVNRQQPKILLEEE